MGRSALVGARTGQSSCGNFARAVTACGKIKQGRTKRMHAHTLGLLQMEPMEHTTTPTYVLYHSYLLSGIPGGWSLFFLFGNHAVVLVLWDVHIIAGWLSCVLLLLLLLLSSDDTPLICRDR